MTDAPGDDDADLRALLAGADPASALPAADPVGVARLMEETMSETPEAPDPHETPEHAATTETRDDHLRRRSPFTWVVAAAAAAVIVGGVGFAVWGVDDAGPQGASDAPVVASEGPSAGDEDVDVAEGAASVTELSITPEATTARCLTPEAAPDVVAAQTLAVDAEVESISGGVVTLAPTRFYAGEETDLVTVAEPSGDLQALLSGVDFEEGERYLVSATDGQVTLCGFSAPYDESLAAVYDEAFAE